MLNQARDYKKNLARQTDLNWDGDFDLEEENQTLAELEKRNICIRLIFYQAISANSLVIICLN